MVYSCMGGATHNATHDAAHQTSTKPAGGDATDPIWCEESQIVRAETEEASATIKCVLFDDGHIDYIFLAVEDEEGTNIYSGKLTPTLDSMRKDLFDTHLRRNKPEERHPDVHRLLLVDAMTMLM